MLPQLIIQVRTSFARRTWFHVHIGGTQIGERHGISNYTYDLPSLLFS